jgi:rhamnose transport system substrate-binding protein
MKKMFYLAVVLSLLLSLVPAVALAAPLAQGEDYVVQRADWLSKLADKYYGNVMYYWAIFDGTNEKNKADSSYAKIDNPDLIEPGWKLYIPTKAEAEKYMAAHPGAAAAPAAAVGGGYKIAFVVKHTGNPYFDNVNKGANEAAKELGDTIIFQGPATSDVAGQIELIDALIAQKVDAIAVSANDPDALVPVGQKAMGAGIKFMSFDSAIATAGRLVHENQADPEQVGRVEVQILGKMLNYEGEIAILSAGATMTNQNTWIEWMKKELEDPKYAKMKLVAVVYGDDDRQKSYNEAQGLFKSYPNLKGIISPTTVGIAATGKALTDAGLCSKIMLTGLGLPSEMAEYIKSGCCKAMALWNPIDQGYLTTYIAHNLAAGTLTPKVGESFKGGRMGDYTVLDLGNGDLQVYQGPPFQFDASNIDQWKVVY